MKNRDIIKNYNGLHEITLAEQRYSEKTGEQLLGGRVTVTYAIRKNMEELRHNIKPYEELLESLRREYRDMEAERTMLEEKMKEYADASNTAKVQPFIPEQWRFGKTKEEFESKLNELLDIDVNVDVHQINVSALDGLSLSSYDLEKFMFMLK